MRRIPLHARDGRVRAYALVDDEDYALVSSTAWSLEEAKGIAAGWRNGKKIKMHRLILGEPPCQVDHINHDKLDNRRQNLRRATNAQNQQNHRGARADNTTGFRGVLYVHGRKSPWKAQVKVGNRIYARHCGTREEAAAAVAALRAEHMPYSPEARAANNDDRRKVDTWRAA